MEYEICDSLDGNSTKHCHCLTIAKPISFDDNKIFIGPDHKSRNGTITFIKYSNRTFGITCWHVVKELNTQREKCNDGTTFYFYIMAESPIPLIDKKFFRVKSIYTGTKLDIVITEFNSDEMKNFGKEAIESEQTLPLNIKFGYAVGFPEYLKYIKQEDEKIRVLSIPSTNIIIEALGQINESFTLYSKFENEYDVKNFSGISGGPIYWSTAKEYGLLGIVYEANKTNFAPANRSLMVSGVKATHEEIEEWIHQYDSRTSDNGEIAL